MGIIVSIFLFLFVFIGSFIVIYLICTEINEKRRKKLKDEEFKRLKEKLSPYEFESTQKMLSIRNFILKNIFIQGIM